VAFIQTYRNFFTAQSETEAGVMQLNFKKCDLLPPCRTKVMEQRQRTAELLSPAPLLGEKRFMPARVYQSCTLICVSARARGSSKISWSA